MCVVHGRSYKTRARRLHYLRVLVVEGEHDEVSRQSRVFGTSLEPDPGKAKAVMKVLQQVFMVYSMPIVDDLWDLTMALHYRGGQN